MSFKTNKYTRPFLLAELRKVNGRKFNDLNVFVSEFSPRAGAKSAKFAALVEVVGLPHLGSLFNGNSGAQVKKQLISLIKNS